MSLERAPRTVTRNALIMRTMLKSNRKQVGSGLGHVQSRHPLERSRRGGRRVRLNLSISVAAHEKASTLT